MSEETTEQKRCLTDEHNFLWVHVGDEGFVHSLTRYLPNGAPGRILWAISEAFDAEIFSEHEPQYWGFDTQEEWDAWQHAIATEHDDEFYADILKFVADEPNGIRAGTVGERWALIAKRLIAGDPGLVASERRCELMEAIHSYDRDHTEYVSLSSLTKWLLS
jgi:hypothetical protein